MVNGLYYADDVINAGREFKIGQFVKYYDNFDGFREREKAKPMKAQVVGIYPNYILLEVFGKLGNFLISCNKVDLISSMSDVYIKPMKIRKKITYYNSRNC